MTCIYVGWDPARICHAHSLAGLEALAGAHGLDLVEASVTYEPWLVRGEN